MVEPQDVAAPGESFWRFCLTLHINPLILRHEFEVDPDIGSGPFDLEISQYVIISSKSPVNRWLSAYRC
jgi:hypothetical protein